MLDGNSKNSRPQKELSWRDLCNITNLAVARGSNCFEAELAANSCASGIVQAQYASLLFYLDAKENKKALHFSLVFPRIKLVVFLLPISSSRSVIQIGDAAFFLLYSHSAKQVHYIPLWLSWK